VRACTFVLAGEPFAVGVDAARGVAVFEDTTPVPGAPAHVLGIANMRGRLVPLLDIRAHLGQAAPWRGRGGKALVIESDGVEVAIAIDDVFGLESFDAVHTLTGEDRARYRDFAVGQLSRSGRPVMLLDAAVLIERLRINRGDREGDATPRAAGKEAR
jgi:purine-binding chemotaxis protein CheW